METAPQQRRIDYWSKVSVAAKCPLAVLLENGPAFSVLLSNHPAGVSEEGNVLLEDCIQTRIEPDGSYRCSLFPKVVFAFDRSRGLWIGSPDHFRSLFSQPSIDPYAMIEIPFEDTSLLEAKISKGDASLIFEYFSKRFASLPRFYSPKPTKLVTGENYANSRDLFDGQQRFL